MVQFTNSFLKNEFKQSYGYYDVKDQQYVITGEKMIMSVDTMKMSRKCM